jgi:hypothetical protein
MKTFQNAKEAMDYVPTSEEYETWFANRVIASMEGLAAGTNKLVSFEVVRQLSLETLLAAAKQRQVID